MGAIMNAYGIATKSILDALVKQASDAAAESSQQSGNPSGGSSGNTATSTGTGASSSAAASSSSSASAATPPKNNTMINSNVDPFITQYRDALERERDLSMQNLDNTRRNDYRTIMGNANASGMLYSNFPERTKIQYDTTNYMPSQSKIQNTYQTGLDKLRTNVVSLSNQLKDINDAIADLNKTGAGGNGSNGKSKYPSWDYGNGYVVYGVDGKAIYTKDGNIISAGNFLEGAKNNWSNWEDMWSKGVHTEGVGNDTIDAYLHRNGEDYSKNDRYKYLYN